MVAQLLPLLRRYWLPLLALVLGAILLWQFVHYTPDDPAALSRARKRQLAADVARHQQALGTDTVKAAANHQAARAALDSGRHYAKQATHYHQQATRHAPKPIPATAADVERLQRELSNYYR